jgi:cytochrome b5
VYDVTAFLPQHPGGEEILLHSGGQDATASFEEVFHSQAARMLTATYRIGLLADDGKGRDEADADADVPAVHMGPAKAARQPLPSAGPSIAFRVLIIAAFVAVAAYLYVVYS